jgi:hypothetical protein
MPAFLVFFISGALAFGKLSAGELARAHILLN